MQSEELRSIQGPLKDRYRGDPVSALITLHAEGRMGEGITCNVETGKMLARAGLHPGTGGDGTNLCSGDMLLQALVACAGRRSVQKAIWISAERSGSPGTRPLGFSAYGCTSILTPTQGRRNSRA